LKVLGMTQNTNQISDAVAKVADPIKPNKPAETEVRASEEKAKPSKVSTEAIEVTREKFDQAVDRIQDFVRDNPKVNLSIYVDERIERPVMKLIDPNEGEVMQIPSEEVIRIAENIELMRGVFFDREA
jgi:uncharacterized FlaG/YvyC family protein